MIITTKRGSIKSNIDGMLLTDGEAYGIEYWLGEDRNVDEFNEISREDYESIMESKKEIN